VVVAGGRLGARARALAEARSRAKSRAQLVFGLGVLGVGLIGGTAVVLGNAAGAANVNCPQGTTEYKVDGNPLNGLSLGQSAPFTVNGQTFTFTKVTGPSPFLDDTFDFTSTVPVTVALVKGGADTNVYNYDPAVTTDTFLHPPLNGGEQSPAISHVSFCIGDNEQTTTSSSTSTSTSTSSSTTSTVPETSSSTESTTSTSTTTSTVPETSSSTESTTSTSTTPVGDQGSTTSTDPTTSSTTTSTQPAGIVAEGTTTIPASTTTAAPVSTTALPLTGSRTLAELAFALSCVVGGGLLVIRRRKAMKPA
jgi:hypothetical protein